MRLVRQSLRAVRTDGESFRTGVSMISTLVRPQQSRASRPRLARSYCQIQQRGLNHDPSRKYCPVIGPVVCVAGGRVAGDLDDRAGLRRFAGAAGWPRVAVGAGFSCGIGHCLRPDHISSQIGTTPHPRLSRSVSPNRLSTRRGSLTVLGKQGLRARFRQP